VSICIQRYYIFHSVHTHNIRHRVNTTRPKTTDFTDLCELNMTLSTATIVPIRTNYYDINYLSNTTVSITRVPPARWSIICCSINVEILNLIREHINIVKVVAVSTLWRHLFRLKYRVAAMGQSHRLVYNILGHSEWSSRRRRRRDNCVWAINKRQKNIKS